MYFLLMDLTVQKIEKCFLQNGVKTKKLFSFLNVCYDTIIAISPFSYGLFLIPHFPTTV